MVNPESYQYNANRFFLDVDNTAREVLGREYKKGFSKGNLVKEAEGHLIECFKKKELEGVQGEVFLEKWLSTYLHYYMSSIYAPVWSVTKNSQLSDIYSEAFYGKVVRLLC